MSGKRSYIPSLSRCLRPAVWMVLIFILFPSRCPAQTGSTAFVSSVSADESYTQARMLEQLLGVPHDELIMLLISLAVVIQIAVNFRFLQWIQHRGLLFCSFGFLLLSVVCTVLGGIFVSETLTYLEHLLFMSSAIFLAAWCWCVFAAKTAKEDV